MQIIVAYTEFLINLYVLFLSIAGVSLATTIAFLFIEDWIGR